MLTVESELIHHLLFTLQNNGDGGKMKLGKRGRGKVFLLTTLAVLVTHGVSVVVAGGGSRWCFFFSLLFFCISSSFCFCSFPSLFPFIFAWFSICSSITPFSVFILPCSFPFLALFLSFLSSVFFFSLSWSSVFHSPSSPLQNVPRLL